MLLLCRWQRNLGRVLKTRPRTRCADTSMVSDASSRQQFSNHSLQSAGTRSVLNVLPPLFPSWGGLSIAGTCRTLTKTSTSTTMNSHLCTTCTSCHCLRTASWSTCHIRLPRISVPVVTTFIALVNALTLQLYGRRRALKVGLLTTC